MADRIIFLFPILILSLFSDFLIYPCYSETDTLRQGEHLKDWDYLISSNKVFSLKFFGFHTTISPYLGVFYNDNDNHHNNENEIFNRAVWVANRNNPIPDVYGNLMIDDHGKLCILSGGGTVVDLFSPALLVERNASVTLLDTGNLVMQELYPDGSVNRVLWQSFDYPTDTLLPGMKLGINLKTGHRWSLTSWRNDELPAQGTFALTGDLNGTGQLVILWRGNTHWMSGSWQNGQFKNTDLKSSGPDVRLYYVSNETEQSFTYLTKSYDSFPALRVLPDGQLKGTALNLDVHCRSIDDPPGCAEEFEKLKCRKNSSFFSAGQYYNDYIFADEYAYENMNGYDCRRICWNNCSCIAFTYAIKNRIGCKTYGKKIYDPFKASREVEYILIKG